MKQFLFVIILGCCSFSICSAQKANDKATNSNNSLLPATTVFKEPRFILNFHGGYAVGLGSTFKFYPDDISSIMITQQNNLAPQKTVTYGNPSKGLGDGFRVGGGISYILNDFINVGMDVDYFKSTINKVRDSSNRQLKSNAPAGEPDDYQYKECTTISYHATLITLTPNITFKAISRPKWFIYNKLGAVITFRPNSLQEEVTNIDIRRGWQGFFRDSMSRVVKEYDWNLKNPALGFMAAFGTQIKIGDRTRAFAELQFSHLVFTARKRTLEKFTVNGAETKNSLPINMRELEFVKTYSENVSSRNADQPSQTLVQRIPISFVGIQAGIAYQLR